MAEEGGAATSAPVSSSNLSSARWKWGKQAISSINMLKALQKTQIEEGNLEAANDHNTLRMGSQAEQILASVPESEEAEDTSDGAQPPEEQIVLGGAGEQIVLGGAGGKKRWEAIRSKVKLLTFNQVVCSSKSGWLQRPRNSWFGTSWAPIFVVVGETQMRWFSRAEDKEPLGILDFQLVHCEVQPLWASKAFAEAQIEDRVGATGLPTGPTIGLDKREYCLGCSGPTWGISAWLQGNPCIFRICPVDDADAALEFAAESEYEGDKWIKALTTSLREAEKKSGHLELKRKVEATHISATDQRKMAEVLGPEWWKVTHIPLLKFEQIVRTGDILLFRSPGNMPMIIRTAGGGRYDHVAMILRLAGGAIALLESTGVQGVGLVTWQEFVSRKWHLIYPELALRRVTFERTEGLITGLQQWAIGTLGKPYGITVGKLMERKSVSAGGTGGDGTFFCSELIAEALKVLKVLPRGTASSQFWPSTFETAQSKNIETLPGCSFDEELIISFPESEENGPAEGRDVTISVF